MDDVDSTGRSPGRLLAVAVALLALWSAAPARAAVPVGFVGMYSDDAFFGGTSERAASLARQAGVGIALERYPFQWSRIERVPGEWGFAEYDGFVAAAAQVGLRMLPVLGDPPPFRSTAPALPAANVWYPPASNADFADFAARLVARYGPNGRFWASRPDLPYLPVEAWQVWNEPNLPVFWGGSPNAAAYAATLKAAYGAIHGVDPAAEVVAAGIPDSSRGEPFDSYVGALVEAGGAAAFDTFAVHAYAAGQTGAIEMTRHARDLLNSLGVTAPLRVTEFGWSTAGPPSGFLVTETEQASWLRITLDTLAAERQALGLRGLVYFKWRDSLVAPGGFDAWPLHAGLLRPDGLAKPALKVLEDALAVDPAAPEGVAGDIGVEADPTPGSGVPLARSVSSLRVRWAELRPRGVVRLHVTCTAVDRFCTGSLAVLPGRRGGAPHGRRSFSLVPAQRAVLTVRLARRAARRIRAAGGYLRVRVRVDDESPSPSVTPLRATRRARQL